VRRGQSPFTGEDLGHRGCAGVGGTARRNSESPERQLRAFRAPSRRRRRSPSSRSELRVQKSAARGSVSSEEYRLAICSRCRVQLRLCRRCDRGQRFCKGCRDLQRRDSVRRAGMVYRRKFAARRLHAAAQRRHRRRQQDKISASKVTHHTVTQARPASTSLLAPESSGGKELDVSSVSTFSRCSLCGAPLPRWARRHRRRAAHRGRARRAPRLPQGPPA